MTVNRDGKGGESLGSAPSRPGFRDAALILAFLLVAGWIGWRLASAPAYEWRWETMGSYVVRADEAGHWRPNLILRGFATTVRLSVWATVLGLFLGTVMGTCRCGRRLFWRLVGGAYVETVRNLPPLVLVFIFYFFVSDRIIGPLGIGEMLRHQTGTARAILEFALGPPRFATEFLSAVAALAVFEGAYIAEIVRAGIQGVERGQWEAASALGLSRWHRMRHVIGPQALRHILPALAGQFISTIKDSSIVSVISIQELTFQGMEVMSATYMTFEIWITVTFLYLSLTLTCSLAVAWLEKRLKSPRMIRIG